MGEPAVGAGARHEGAGADGPHGESVAGALLEPVERWHARFPALDGLRAIAALSVVAFHVALIGYRYGPFQTFAKHLNSGVTIFFVLSGFLLYRPFLVARAGGRTVEIRSYLTRRVARIVPAYWLALIGLSIWPGLPGLYSGHWLAAFGFVQIYSRTFEGTGLSVAWSLCTEISFYLVLPFFALAVAWLARRVRAEPLLLECVVLCVVAIASAAIHVVIERQTGSDLRYVLPSTAYLFCAGMLVAACSVWAAPRLSRLLAAIARHRALCWVAAAALLVAASEAAKGSGPTNPIYVPTAVLLVLPLTLAPRGTARLDRFLTTPVVRTLGVLSYGIYLWHDPLIPKLADAVGPLGHFGGFAMLCIAAAAATLAAGVSYLLVERPALTLAHRRR